MKQIMCGLLFLLLFTLPALAQDADFRETAWGMSKTQVMQAETAELKADNGSAVIYDAGKVKSMPALLAYHFTADDRLAMATYNYAPQSFDGERVISRYNDMKKALAKQFGEPESDVVIWSSTEEKESFNGNTELGLLADQCVFEAQWRNDRSAIRLSLEQGEQALVITESHQSNEYIEFLAQEGAEQQ